MLIVSQYIIIIIYTNVCSDASAICIINCTVHDPLRTDLQLIFRLWPTSWELQYWFALFKPSSCTAMFFLSLVVHDQYCSHLQPLEEQWDSLLRQWSARLLRWHGLARQHQRRKTALLSLSLSVAARCSLRVISSPLCVQCEMKW